MNNGNRQGWKECKLGDVVELVGGGTPKTTVLEYWNGDIPWLSVVDFNTGNKYVYNTEKAITKKGLENSSTKLLNEGDIIISARGTVGALAVLKKKMAFNQSCYGIKNITDISDRDYLYYLTKDSINNLQQIAHGGVFDTITRETFSQIELLLPPLPEQRAIASVLSSLDDKIDLLHRQNKTLEGMAEVVYWHFFVDGRKADWKECAVSELATHEKNSINPNKKPEALFYHYSVPAFDDTHMPIPEPGILIKSNKYTVPKNTILFSKLNPHKDKRVWLIPSQIDENSICSTEFQVMNPKAEKYLFFLYSFISHPENYDGIAAGVGGTSGSHQRIDPEVIFKFTCFLPDESTLTNYNEMVEPIFDKMHHNRKSIQNLIQQRDLLLPKLMSGEVRVKD